MTSVTTIMIVFMFATKLAPFFLSNCGTRDISKICDKLRAKIKNRKKSNELNCRGILYKSRDLIEYIASTCVAQNTLCYAIGTSASEHLPWLYITR